MVCNAYGNPVLGAGFQGQRVLLPNVELVKACGLSCLSNDPAISCVKKNVHSMAPFLTIRGENKL